MRPRPDQARVAWSRVRARAWARVARVARVALPTGIKLLPTSRQ